MPRRRRVEKVRLMQLDMLEELELVIGPGGGGSAFASEEARRVAWLLHGAEMAADHPGCWGERQYGDPLDGPARRRGAP